MGAVAGASLCWVDAGVVAERAGMGSDTACVLEAGAQTVMPMALSMARWRASSVCTKSVGSLMR
jgi:hypothetical protein